MNDTRTFFSLRKQKCSALGNVSNNLPGAGNCEDANFRRVIFPTLAKIPVSEMKGSVPSILQKSGEIISSSIAEEGEYLDLPPLDKEALEEARSSVDHLLALAPLQAKNVAKASNTRDHNYVSKTRKISCQTQNQNKNNSVNDVKEKWTLGNVNISTHLLHSESRREKGMRRLCTDVNSAVLYSACRQQQKVEIVIPLPRSPKYMAKSTRVQRKLIEENKQSLRSILPNICQYSPCSYPGVTSPQHLCSILRSKSKQVFEPFQVANLPVSKISSIDSDIPSLSPSSVSTDEGEISSTPSSPSEGRRLCPKSVSFDPRVWIHEFRRSNDEIKSTWFTAMDLESFKFEAIRRIVKGSQNQRVIPTGTGRMITQSIIDSKALFSHPALRCDLDGTTTKYDTKSTPDKTALDSIIQKEFRTMLLVDPQDICLKLFSKSFKDIMPHVSITTVQSSEEALQCSEENECAFDVIIIEERLKLFHRQAVRDLHGSGSLLMRKLSEISGRSLFIGVSAHIHEDSSNLKNSGADFCWSKPPPAINRSLLADMAKTILKKRGKTFEVNELM